MEVAAGLRGDPREVDQRPPSDGWSGKRDSNPRPSAWKADALPLSYSRSSCFTTTRWWRGEDSNLRRLRRQIYSLLPLTARVPLQRRHELERGKRGARRQRAGEGTRTPNRLITNEMLYQLSYASASRGRSGTAKIERGSGAVKPRLETANGSRRAHVKRQPRYQRIVWCASVAPGCLFPRRQ